MPERTSLRETMRTIRYILIVVLGMTLLAASASAVTRKPKSGDDKKAKTSDSVKQRLTAPDTAKAQTLPLAPANKDSSAKRKVAPTKFNDFLDKNKNGIDDRLEKPSTGTRKPVSTTKKPADSKKSTSTTAKPEETKKPVPAKTKTVETKKADSVSKPIVAPKKSK